MAEYNTYIFVPDEELVGNGFGIPLTRWRTLKLRVASCTTGVSMHDLSAITKQL
jgi:hypothetical protein